MGLDGQQRNVLPKSARVVIADINAEKGETAAQEMSAGGAAIEFIAVNVTDESSQQALFDDVVRRYGQLDIVVAAAGISSAGYVSGEVSAPAEDPGLQPGRKPHR